MKNTSSSALPSFWQTPLKELLFLIMFGALAIAVIGICFGGNPVACGVNTGTKITSTNILATATNALATATNTTNMTPNNQSSTNGFQCPTNGSWSGYTGGLCGSMLALLCAGSFLFVGIIFGLLLAANPSSSKGATNIQQVSDWIIKALIGGGLIELKSIYHAIQNGILVQSGGMPTGINSAILTFAALYFGIDGMLLAYFWGVNYFKVQQEAPDSPPEKDDKIAPQI